MAVNDHQDDNSTDHADSVPALLAAFHAIRKDYVERIAPNLARQLGRDPVLGEIRCGLLIVPLKITAASVFTNMSVHYAAVFRK